MEDDYTFLNYLIDEEIYVIPEDNNFRQEASVETPEVHPLEKDHLPTFTHVTVLLLDYASASDVPEDILELLSKIMKSVDLDDQKIERVCQDKINQLHPEVFKDCKILAFSNHIPGHLADCFDPQRYKLKSVGTNQFLFCDALETIGEDRNLKRMLWEQLKKLYTLTT